MEPKQWGKHEFWGLGSEWDPQWSLTEKQKELQKKLIEVCRTKIRPQAVISDKTYEFPRKSLDALAELGLLGLTVPKELGGAGENHVCVAMVVETIARYGCPSTAMIYVMHLVSVGGLLLFHHNNNHIKQLLRRLDKDKLVGTLAMSDPATGGHIWYPLSSKCREVEGGYRMLKFISWVTSAGFADFYNLPTGMMDGEYQEQTFFVVYKDEIRSSCEEWSALGMHGNQSGPVICEAVLPRERRIGNFGDGTKILEEGGGSFFLLGLACTYNGISLGAMDIAKKHVTRKAHADVGIRVCDYAVVQDYFGASISSTEMCRLSSFHLASRYDELTNNNDWSIYKDPKASPRTSILNLALAMKVSSCKNVGEVTDAMLHACGGSGYKSDLGIERYLRDGKAGWVMGYSNEVMQSIIGKSALLGISAIDLWQKNVDERVLNHEVEKLSAKDKRELAKKLIEDADNEERKEEVEERRREEDFDNPFTTEPPSPNSQTFTDATGVSHAPGLSMDKFTKLKLLQRTPVSSRLALLEFSLPEDSNHLGCFPGQYIQVRIPSFDGYPSQQRYFSPVSCVDDYGKVKLLMKYETNGILSMYFKKLNKGDEVEFRGPMGGFEYKANSLSSVTLFTSGGGITPCIQLIRTIMKNKEDKTRVTLFFYCDKLEEMVFIEELLKFEKNDDRLKVVLSLGEIEVESWEGEEGYIDKKMIKRHGKLSKGKDHKIILCGGATMILSLLYGLKSLQILSDQIFVFGAFGAEQVRKAYGRNCKLSSHYCESS